MTELIRQQRSCSYIPWISRRVRGKVIERLVVDCGQFHRQSTVHQEKATKRESMIAFRECLTQFCKEVIDSTSSSGSIGFSAIRSLARRLKQPLCDVLNPSTCIESKELGLRLGNICLKDVKQVDSSKGGYSDWSPTTDYFLANSLVRDCKEPGGRCSFVGFEDENDNSLLSNSLNVEELAMDLYKSGRLPCKDEGNSFKLLGGWTGWHDEGSHIRTLFRIICAPSLLGMDFGHPHSRFFVDEKETEHSTVHLSPYQQAPFDLLVGHELQRSSIDTDRDCYVPSRSFYCRRADDISKFLDKLAKLVGEDLSNVVYDSVASRLAYLCAQKRRDPFLDRDIMQVRTLSALAAGFGGQCLSSIFRCLLFDYRHYSGGLPDLHLFRVLYDCDDTATATECSGLVDLGDWIGESFSKENHHVLGVHRAFDLLSDGGEFLGFTDSATNYRKARGGSRQSAHPSENPKQSTVLSVDILPNRLELTHNGRLLQVECLMVEVKSSTE
jgi:hypothetical protein